MPRRVEIDETLPAAVLPERILNELFAHAREVHPEECCGLVIGDAAEPYARVVRCTNDMTQHHKRDPQNFPRDGRRAFWMNEREYMEAFDEAEKSGQDVTAVYHSHIDVGAYLSDMDLEFAEQPHFPFPEADHIVLSVVGRVVRSAALFQRIDGRFVGRGIQHRASR